MSLYLEVHWECWFWSHGGALDRVSVCQQLLTWGVTLTLGQSDQRSLMHLSAGAVCVSLNCLRAVWILTAERIPAAFTAMQILFWENILWTHISSSKRQELQYPVGSQVEYALSLLICFSKIFPFMHMMQSTSSRINPIYSKLLSQEQGWLPLPLLSSLTCC